jgi:hypothetical protein
MQIDSGPNVSNQELEGYFESIRTAFEETLTATEFREVSDGFHTTITFFFLLFFSLVPVIPALAYFGARWISKPIVVNLWIRQLSIHSFLFWYVFSTALFALLFGIRLRYSSFREKKNKKNIKKDELLNEPQMRFALCHAVRSEIESYRTNKRPVHMERARSLWKKLIPSIQEVLGSGESWIDTPSGFPSPDLVLSDQRDVRVVGDHLRRHFIIRKQDFFPEINNLLSRFSWFKLETTTRLIIEAFNGLTSKLTDRILDRKELFQVSECLFPLSFYLYTQIPDISDTESEKAYLALMEDKALNLFVANMEMLTPYTSESRNFSPVEPSSAKKEKARDVLSITVGNPSPFIRFCCIWAIVQAFVAIAVPIFLLAIKTLKFDSTLIALLIGSPLAIAAALTAIPTNSRTGKTEANK